VSRRVDQLGRHVRRLGNHALNELLLQLPPASFAALVDVALARPVLPAGLVLRFEPAGGVDGWSVVACAPRRRLGTLTRTRAAGWATGLGPGPATQSRWAGSAGGGGVGMRPRPWPGSPR
jgi:hypothetical protein